MKQRTYEYNGKKAEIIGPSNKCIVFINGASHPVFTSRFTSIKAARNRFLSWAKNVENTATSRSLAST